MPNLNHDWRNLIDEEAEELFIKIRYNDLNQKTQEQLAMHLKQGSSYLTVTRLEPEQIQKVLTVTNPILVADHYSATPHSWSYSQMPRWREKRLSAIVYHGLIRNQNETSKRIIEDQIRTPNKWTASLRMQNCRHENVEEGRETPWHYIQRVCQNCRATSHRYTESTSSWQNTEWSPWRI